MTFINTAGRTSRQLGFISLPLSCPLPTHHLYLTSLTNHDLFIIAYKECWNVDTQSVINWKRLDAAVRSLLVGESLGYVKWIFSISFMATCGKTTVSEEGRLCAERWRSRLTWRDSEGENRKAFFRKGVLLRNKVVETIFQFFILFKNIVWPFYCSRQHL